MVKSQKKLLLSEIIIIGISLITIIQKSTLSGYIMILFLLAYLGLFKIMFGFEKYKQERLRNHISELLIFIITFWIVYYLFGILVGLTRIYINSSMIIHTILPIMIYIVEREFLRYQILKKCDTNKWLTGFSIIFFIILDLTSVSLLITKELNIMVLFPLMASNIVYTYINKKSGYLPVIFYAEIISIYRYLFPVIPNIPIPITMAIDTLLPILLWVRMNSFYERVENPEKHKIDNRLNLSILLVPVIILSTMIYFSSGLFRFEVVAVATNHLKPDINRGDIVVIDKNNNKLEEIKMGEIVAYKENNQIMIHRVVKKTMDQEVDVFYIKENKELKRISAENIVGTIHFKLQYLGIPSLWFNEE